MKLLENKAFVIIVLASILIAFYGSHRAVQGLERRVKTVEANQQLIVNAMNNLIEGLQSTKE